MRTETLIKDSAQVVRVVELAPGDVYKRLVKKDYSETYEIKIGIVQDVVSNGERAALTALEFQTGYNTATPKIEVFADDSELNLFVATPAEVETFFDDVRDAARRQVEQAEDAAVKARRVLEAVKQASQLALSTPKSARDFRPEIKG
jgi:hypothetical protein